MKSNTKSSVTLPGETFATVKRLRKRLGAKSNVEVVRRGLELLEQRVERQSLRAAYREAAAAVREHTPHELAELNHLSGEGLEE